MTSKAIAAAGSINTHPLPQRKLGPIFGQFTLSLDDGPQLALGQRVT